MERLAGGTRHAIYRDGDVVRRAWQDWTPAVHALLEHLERAGFRGAPRLIRGGVDAEGRAVWSFIEGRSPQPDPWSDEGIAELGALIRELHAAAADFVPPEDARWQRWWIHDVRPAGRGIGHGELAPWNALARDGHPVAFVDWEFAGPVDPRVDLAQAAWLNAQLHGELVAARVTLPPAEARAQQLRLFLEAYALERSERRDFLDLMIEVAVRSAAHEARLAAAAPLPARGTEDSGGEDEDEDGPLWAVSWRADAAGWMLANRSLLEDAIR